MRLGAADVWRPRRCLALGSGAQMLPVARRLANDISPPPCSEEFGEKFLFILGGTGRFV